MARNIFDPDVSRFIIADSGEEIVDEVQKHWMAIAWPVLRLFCALVLIFMVTALPSPGIWIGLGIALIIAIQAGYRVLQSHLDRFVITNIRVFRVHGVFTRQVATMPMTRILDIAIKIPLIGRICGYGHFIFESAAQDQGLRDVRFVPRPYERDLTIQRAVQRSGIRGTPKVARSDNDGT